MTFTATYYSLIPLIIFVTSIYIFALVAKNNKNRVSRAFLIYNFFISLYLLKDVLMWSSLFELAPVSIVRVGSITWLSLGFVFVNFIYALVKKKKDFLYYSLLITSIGFIYVSLTTDLIVNSFVKYYWGYQGAKGELTGISTTLILILPALYCLWILVHGAFTSTGIRQKKQYLYIFYGSALYIILGFIFGIVVPNFLDIHTIPEFGSAFTFVQLVFIYIAVIKYRFLSIEVEDVADQLFSSINDGVILVDDNHKLSHINKAAKKIFNVKDEQDLEYFKISDYFPNYDYEKDYESEQFEYEFENSKKTVMITQSKLKNESGVGHISIIKDVTKERNAVNENINMQKQVFLAAKLASIGELSAGVAHEINNPLMILLGNIDIVKEFVDNNVKGEEGIKIALERQIESVNRISVIVEGLRTYARTDSSEVEDFDINDAVERSVNLVQSIYSKSGININMSLNHEIPTILGSYSKFQQVIMNLLSNAKDALEHIHNGIISIRTYSVEKSIFIEVQDNGVGISREAIDKIFDSFYTTKEVGKGTGLGLSISYSIIKSMGGDITVSSSKEEGTTFTVVLKTL
jgi:signal transduction histidine kinase